ncbi:MAG: membrane protein insertase YidC [Anaeromyxobacter sp.]
MSAETRRFVLAIALSLAVVFVWQTFAPKPQKPAPAPAPVQVTPAPEAAKNPEAPAPAQGGGQAAAAAPVDAPEELVTLEGAEFTAQLSSHGGTLKHYQLRDHKFQDLDVVHVTDGQPFPLALVPSPELGGGADAASDRWARAPMRVVSKDARSVVFEGRVGSVEVRKTIAVTGKPYELAVRIEASGGAKGGTVSVLFPSYQPPNAQTGGIFSGPPLNVMRPVCRAGTSTERYDLAKDPGSEKVAGDAVWMGADQHYFIGALVLDQAAGTCVFTRGPAAGTGLVALVLPLEGPRTVTGQLFVGPKDIDYLRVYGRSFETAIEYGAFAKPFALFARGLLYVMRWLASIVKNWGVAIILLTLLVKVVLLPLTYKSMKSMNEMRRLQPEMEKLKAKFPGPENREKLQMATMQMYQQHKVNPLGGCLPMLLQMPIWFALYAALQTSVELYRQPFLWMADLTAKDPFYILPLLMGVSSFLMQKLAPQPADNAQAKMMLYFMPAIFTVMMLGLPAGLTLYIFVNNLLSIIQQQAMFKQTPAVATAK